MLQPAWALPPTMHMHVISSLGPCAASAWIATRFDALCTSFSSHASLTAVSGAMASHTPSLAIRRYDPSGKGSTLVSGMGLSHGPQSLSPSARAQATPPG